MKQYLLLSIIFITSYLCASVTIDQLTLDQKIGQLFMVAASIDKELKKSYRTDEDYIEELITQYHIGGIIFLGKSDAEQQIERTEYFQSISAIPLLIGQDLEPGRVGTSRLAEMNDFPNSQTLGKINNSNKTYKTALAIGQLCKKLGVHINFAPVTDVNNNPDNPVINDRSFGNNASIVLRHTIAFAWGLRDAGIIACAKHFPGHGDTTIDSHAALPIIMHNAQRLHAIELYPFKKVIAAGIPAIMVGHLEVPAFEDQPQLPSSLSKKIVTDLLQKELGFKGLIITDGLDMGAITNTYCNGQAEVQAMIAGNDILLSSVDVPAAIAAIKQAIVDGLITEQEIDAHVAKILRIKNSVCYATPHPNRPL